MTRNLTERIPDHLVDRWRTASIFWVRLVIGGVTALWLPIGAGLAWLPFRNGSASLQLVSVCVAIAFLLLAWCLLVYFLGRFATSRWSRSRLPIVEIAGEIVTVRWHGETIESKVAQCNFRYGRAWQMKYAAKKASGLPFGDRDLILIDLPPLYRDCLGKARAYTTVAVGYSDDSMDDWTAALGLVGEP
ncbi:MAG: hypothetical protein WBD31_30215 [Rubripirellula sp.]